MVCPREGYRANPPTFDSYIREIVAKMLNPVGAVATLEEGGNLGPFAPPPHEICALPPSLPTTMFHNFSDFHLNYRLSIDYC